MDQQCCTLLISSAYALLSLSNVFFFFLLFIEVYGIRSADTSKTPLRVIVRCASCVKKSKKFIESAPYNSVRLMVRQMRLMLFYGLLTIKISC